MRINQFQRESGDTLIEVMVSVAVFAMVAIGTISIMNAGVATAERAVQVTQVRQQIDAQAETLRYLQQAYIAQYQAGTTASPGSAAAEWQKILLVRETNASPFGNTISDGTCKTGPRPFLLNAREATLWSGTPTTAEPAGGSLPPFAQVSYNGDNSIAAGYGLWVEAIASPGGITPGFTDFHIRACWQATGSGPQSTLGTIVRLYEPK